MKRYLFILISSLAIVLGALLIYATPAHAASYDTSNLIDDSVYYNKSSMTQDQIQNFINAFPKSCLLPQNYPAGLGQITFKEPLNYFNYGSTDVSPARIIWDVSQYYNINPQVLLVTLEKEQNLVSGNSSVGCPVRAYNSAMGYNCPDGSENALKDYPDSGIFRTCVAKESNAGFARQVNHAAWQLSFDGKRANGELTWMGDGDTSYGGRMTQGWRSRVNGGASVYYDGYTTIDGQSIYLSNGSTAALYNYTPHFNSFTPIFTNWFGSPTGTVQVTTPLTISSIPPEGVFTNHDMTVSFTIVNTTSSRQDLGTMTVAARDGSGNNYDFQTQRVVLDPNQSYVYRATQRFTKEDTYSFWITNYRDGIGWDDNYPTSSNNRVRRIDNQLIQNIPTISQSPGYTDELRVGRASSVSFKVKNNSTLPIDIGKLALALRDPNNLNADLALVPSGVIAPGAEYVYTQSFIPQKIGIYSGTVVSTRNNGVSWNDSTYPESAAGVNRTVQFTVKPNPTITTSIQTNNPTPHVGQSITLSFKVKNYGSTSVSLGNIGLAGRDPAGRNVDPGVVAITLAPGEERTLSFNTTPSVTGNYTFSLISTSDYRTWGVGPVGDSGSIQKILSVNVLPNPTLTQGPTLSVASPHIGEQIAMSFKIKNYSDTSANVGYIGLAVRDPEGKNVDAGALDLTVNSNSEYTFQANPTFQKSGTYTAWITVYRNGVWDDTTYPTNDSGSVMRRVQFTVKPNPTITTSIQTNNPTPHVGQSITLSFKVKNYGSTSVSLGNIGLAGRDPAGRNVDPGVVAITLAPGEERTVSFNSTPTTVGSYTYSLISTSDYRTWGVGPVGESGSIQKLLVLNVLP